MGRIRMGRVAFGGLVAGIVINIGMFLMHGLMLKDDWQRAMQALGHVASQDDVVRSLVLFNVEGFVVGLFGVWLYAAMRPRFGARPGTALRAGIATWVGVSLAPALTQIALRLIHMPLVGDFFIFVVALLVGAALYQEPASAEGAAA